MLTFLCFLLFKFILILLMTKLISFIEAMLYTILILIIVIVIIVVVVVIITSIITTIIILYGAWRKVMFLKQRPKFI